MPPLTWRNVDEPDLTRASDILARAATGLQDGFGGLGDNFGNMHEIQRRNRSAAALGQLAGVTGGSNVDAILGQVGAGIDPMYRTDALNAAIANARGTALGYDQTRANTGSVNAETHRLNMTFNRNIAREDALAALTPELARMQQDAYAVDGGASPGAATAALLRDFEGFRETAYYDVDAHRTGYGSDTVTTADGRVQPVTPDTVVTREDAERDLARRVETEFLPRVVEQVGADAFGRLSTQQQAVLGSIAYNYGSLPDSVARAVQGGDQQAIANAIVGLSGHNDGVNAGRRQREAQLFLNGGGAGNYVPDIAALLGENTVLRPEDIMGLIDNLYGDRRTALANQAADQSAADQALAAAETARQAQVTQAANDWAFQNRDGFGPDRDAELERVFTDESLSQEEIVARQSAITRLYDDNPGYFALPADERLESPIDMIVTETLAHMDQAQTNDPLLNAVRNAGIVPGQTVAGTDAEGEITQGEGEGATRAEPPQSPEAQIRAMRERIGQTWNQEEDAWEGSGMSQNDGELLALVDDMDRELNGAVDRNTLVALLEFSRRPVMGLLGRPTGEVAVNEELFRQQASQLAQPGQLAVMREAVRQEQLQRDEVSRLQSDYDAAYSQQQYWMERSDREGDPAYQRAMAEARRQQVIESELRGIYDRTAPNIPETSATEGTQRETQDFIGADSGARIDAIIEGAVAPGTPTASGAVVDPEASNFAQGNQRQQQLVDVNTGLTNIDQQLNHTIRGGWTMGLTDNLVSQREFASREIERAVARDARTFFRSEEGIRLLASDPAAMRRAMEDPVDFYLTHMESDDPRRPDPVRRAEFVPDGLAPPLRPAGGPTPD